MGGYWIDLRKCETHRHVRQWFVIAAECPRTNLCDGHTTGVSQPARLLFKPKPDRPLYHYTRKGPSVRSLRPTPYAAELLTYSMLHSTCKIINGTHTAKCIMCCSRASVSCNEDCRICHPGAFQLHLCKTGQVFHSLHWYQLCERACQRTSENIMAG